jgi:chromosome segregation ATPase
MLLFILLGVIVLITFVILGVLFFTISKEGEEKVELYTGPISSGSQSPLQMQSEVKQASIEDEVYKKRAQELEGELLAITRKAAGQSDEARQVIENLTKENETFKSQQVNLEQTQQKLIELQGKVSNLETENVSLQTQAESNNGKMRLLEEQMAVVKIQMGEEISRANATVSELNHQKEVLNHELIKARAQSSGLERVSFNYKNQLENFLK